MGLRTNYEKQDRSEEEVELKMMDDTAGKKRKKSRERRNKREGSWVAR